MTFQKDCKEKLKLDNRRKKNIIQIINHNSIHLKILQIFGP